jgi:hypothetical protein
MTSESSMWRLVQFPSPLQRKEFLDQVRLWNLVDGLPPIETRIVNDGWGLKVATIDSAQKNVMRLIDAFGGAPAGA